MMDPMVEERKVVVSGIKPEDKERCASRRTHQTEQFPYRDRSEGGNEERRGDERCGLGMVMQMTTPQDRRRAVQHPSMHGVLEQAEREEAEEDDASSHTQRADKPVDPQAQEDQRRREIDHHRD